MKSVRKLSRGINAELADKPNIFSNFECDQLTSDERLYLHAASTGDLVLLKEILHIPNLTLNYNCVDYMGRNTLHLAVDAENVDMVDFLLNKLAWECIEEALLHAISKGYLAVVRLIINHPVYKNEEIRLNLVDKRKDSAFWKEEKYTYSPDITPLILAAHQNDHEMVQIFLARGYKIARPHDIQCPCDDCRTKQDMDSLKRSLSRLNAYKALSSPAYMALSSPDPITTTFELRQEMMAVADIEKEFKNDYLSMVDQCMDFACHCMNLCRGTQEMDAIMGGETPYGRDPLARLRLAVNYGEKKFVAHPNTQQHLTNIWYGKEMSFLQSISGFKQIILLVAVLPLLPLASVIYMLKPGCKVSKMMMCPVSKFITHTWSHLIFLVLLAVATFGLEDPGDSDIDHQMRKYLRPARWPITPIQTLIMFWILGIVYLECKQVYKSGAVDHFLNYYNMMDFTILALYLASYSLRCATLYRLTEANKCGNTTYTDRARTALKDKNNEEFEAVIAEAKSPLNGDYYYFMAPSRFEWLPGDLDALFAIANILRFEWVPDDPEIIADALFAIANILSFAKTTYVMPSHELLGPLQISLGRMFSDIARFLVLFLLLLVAFMVGMTNLYRYYGVKNAADNFKGLPQTVQTLFFSIFGLVGLGDFAVTKENITVITPHSTDVVETIGLVLFAVFQVAVTIVLVNMLIAMMSHSFEAIQDDNDVEWKYARTRLWLNFIDEGSTVPVPFNIVPTPKTFKYAYYFCKEMFSRDDEEEVVYDFKKRRGHMSIGGLEKAQIKFTPKAAYSEIIQRLMRRYLFQMDREKEVANVDICGMEEDYGSKENEIIEEVVTNTEHALPKVDTRFVRKRSSARNRSRKESSFGDLNSALEYKILHDIQQKLQRSDDRSVYFADKITDMMEVNHRGLINILQNQNEMFKTIEVLRQALQQYVDLCRNQLPKKPTHV